MLDDQASDGALAGRVAQGDRAAAAVLVHRHQASVRAFLRRLTGRHDLADDLAQETFIRLLRHAGSFDARYPMRTWLFTIARRLWISLGRRPGLRLNSDALDDAPAPGGPYDAAADADQAGYRRSVLDVALAQLTEPQRLAIVLCYQHEMPLAQVARVMELPIGTVKSHLHRGRAALRELLADQREVIEVSP